MKVLDKGIIFELGNNLEGIVPLKRMKKHEKNHILANFNEGDSHEVTVQEVDEEYKKIILIMELSLDGELVGEDTTTELDTPIIEETDEAVPEAEDVKDDDEPEADESKDESPESTDEAPEVEDVKDDDELEADESKDESPESKY